MTTRPNSAPWADGPFKLIPTPNKTTHTKSNTHSAIYCASEMAYSHNCLLRGLNAIVLQGPHVSSANQPGYQEQDVKDFMFYAESWCKMVDHHHMTEETTMFPLIEELAGEPGLMDGAQDQHKEFHDGLIALQNYAAAKRLLPTDYRWKDVKKIVDDFAESLTRHLTEEINIFLSLERLDSKGLREAWDKSEEVAKANGNIALLYDVFPVVLGCCDKTYEGGNSFPPLPGVLPYAIKYWFATYNKGAWRFNPCDFWGQPKPLEMLPENKA